jgi:K(+)-stimulated pyrophosphate-energized sodium pump
MTDLIVYSALGAAALALVVAAVYSRLVLAAPAGNETMVAIASAIRLGANTFLRREYTWMAAFVALLAVLIAVLTPWGAPWGSVAYVFGALLSAAAGLIGMRIATAANTRTAEAARRGGAGAALRVAFRGGAVMGFTVAGLGLLGVALGYLLFNRAMGIPEWAEILAAIGLGGSSVALFARVGGGIFTKAADMGADMVGKVEVGIPEDDPRNPAVIADNVGDNVGDVAGMGADLFESYVGALVAPIAFAAIAFADATFQVEAIVFPLAVAALGMGASIIASFLVRSRGDDLAVALRRGTLGAAAITSLGVAGLAFWIFDGVGNPLGVFGSVMVGLIVGLLIGQISEWFTSDGHRSVKEIARQSQTGPATVVITGLAEGMRSAAFSVLVVAAGILGAFTAGQWALGDGGGVYGVAIAAIGVLATVGMTISVDAYGPVADNAGGIAQMAHLPSEVREAIDALDALGNNTAAVSKGFAIASAAVTALALVAAFTEAAGISSINLTRVDAVVGLFIGAMFPFLFAALTMNAVGRAAGRMIDEVRRQFREIAGLRDGKPGVQPDYGACVDIATRAALGEMIVPSAAAIALPLIIGFIDVEALGAFLVGSLVTGFLLAIYMANAGGAWDNAKKFVEAGAYGGKGSDAHRAVLVGDTVGDPFKDTSGPALNIVIKVMAIVSLIFASSF